MSTRKRRPAAGIEELHARSCSSRDDRRCNCAPSYRASVWDTRAKKLIRRTFPMRADAKTWREEAVVAVRQGTMRAAAPQTVEQAAEGAPRRDA
jgi:integrase